MSQPAPPVAAAPPHYDAPAKVPAHLESSFQQLAARWLRGEEEPPSGGEAVLSDLSEAAAGLDEQRQALGRLQQEAQQRQAKVASLDGQMQACLRVLHRLQTAQQAQAEG